MTKSFKKAKHRKTLHHKLILNIRISFFLMIIMGKIISICYYQPKKGWQCLHIEMQSERSVIIVSFIEVSMTNGVVKMLKSGAWTPFGLL